ncbi:hypothetical protein CHLRE_12g545550v5 [Chlamydomonas reinhardtii]|uniref:Uncharacterized protein n=1 Tax=Chlamydomonas reinhardtii TaxID=3055 RepID=A0A2K3D6J3_CHLRE|nr:uncharacterized protein CHLRE_12g545550v5 [Chlamydomonas reinhardtii]XP_042919109.1 uncharacterized protein CHLRE_12g545550v5 [Chlamydomonas reinhardtii]PNW76157.1 hypothetical protein CHLRE_12g545550v5 [Chlamydomonas reinhardtii]PNW76158.1 hypothetical protein CHLRE_12g545550v5 [Chlamydomonas reinhardtii]
MRGRALLSRYRSAAGVSLPRACPAVVTRTGNPVQEWDAAAEYRAGCLADFVATRGAAPQEPGGRSTGTDTAAAERLLRTSFRVWDGPLAGIAHVEGQFKALYEGPKGEEAAAQSPPTDDLAEALAADLEALLAAARAARHVVYDISGSESDFGLLPLILEPRRSSGRGSSSKEPCGTGSSSGGAGLHEGVEGTARGTEAEGAWWSVAEAVAAPLTWGEVAASLGVLAPELVVALAPPEQNVFHDRETFWRHMWERHISRLGGGAAREGDGGGGEGVPCPPPPLDSLAAVDASSASAAAASGASGGGDASGAAPSSAAAMADAVRCFLDAVQLPSAAAATAGGDGGGCSSAAQQPAVMQVFLGLDVLGWNPIPLMWLGRSRRSGAILGLMTAVVWT